MTGPLDVGGPVSGSGATRMFKCGWGLTLCTLSVALTGCETATMAGSSGSVSLSSFEGSTVQDLSDALVGFHLVDARDTNGKRLFLFASDPVMVTTTLPSYTPTTSRFNSPQVAAASANLNSIYATPQISRTTVTQCNVYVLADPRGAVMTLNDWIVSRSEREGQC